MMNYFNVSMDSISIVAKNTEHQKSSKLPRISNKLIWAINSFLAEQFNLLEIVTTKFNSFSLIQLDEAFLHESVVSEGELISEYKSHKSDGISFEFFKEVYTLEMIDSLRYVALKGKDVYETNFNKKDLHKKILSIADVYISIVYHDNMKVIVRDKVLLSKIVAIVTDFAEELR